MRHVPERGQILHMKVSLSGERKERKKKEGGKREKEKDGGREGEREEGRAFSVTDFPVPTGRLSMGEGRRQETFVQVESTLLAASLL